MNRIVSKSGVRRVAVLVAILAIAGLAGCATGPGSSGTASSSYKGNAVWNISRLAQGSRVVG